MAPRRPPMAPHDYKGVAPECCGPRRFGRCSGTTWSPGSEVSGSRSPRPGSITRSSRCSCGGPIVPGVTRRRRSRAGHWRRRGGRIPRRRRQSALDRPRERPVGQDGHATCRHQARRYLQPPGDRHDERSAAHADLGGIRTRQVADRRRSGFPVQEQPELPDPGQAQQVRREGFSAHRLVPDLPAQDHLRLPASRSCARWLFARNARACGGSPSRDRARSSGRRCRPWWSLRRRSG